MTTAEIEAGQARARENLVRARLAGRRPAAGRIPRADRGQSLPLSYGQQQMWFLNRLEPGSPEYLVPLALRLHGPLDPQRLATAWAALLDRHEILRTRYALDDAGTADRPVQIIDAAPVPGALPMVDLTAVPAGERDARTLELVKQVAATPFDLAVEWPARATLIRLTDEEHVLVVVLHHIACDAWSVGLLTRDLAACYAGTRPAALPVQYADYAAWERGQAAPVHERHLAHWRTELADLTPVELPADRPRPALRDWHGDVVDFQIPATVADRLTAVGRRHDATLFMVLMTAFQTLLSRYTGQTDIPVGTMVSGRTRPELQDLIGYGINSLVVRTRWTGDLAFTQLLTRTRDAVLGAFDHQDVPFARLVDELQPERDMSRTPLFQVALTLQDARDNGFDLGPVRATPLTARSAVSRFEVTALFDRTADGTLAGHLEYATALFDRTTVERMAAHLTRLLVQVAAEPELPVSAIEILDAAERTVLSLPPVSTSVVESRVHEVYAARVLTCPDATALVCGGVRLSYAELDECANRFANHLVGLGVGPGVLVGVHLEREPELIPVLLGVLKAGGAYLPLDPAQPVDRLGFMVSDAGVDVVVTSADLAGPLGSVYDGRLVDVDDPEISGCDSTDPGVSGSVDDLVYVIYTSGSTGRPKGVCLSHRNVARLMAVGDGLYGFRADDVWPLFHSFAFDVSVWEMWGALLFGGTLVVMPRAVTRSPDEFLDLLVEHRVTVLNQTPTAFRSLVALAAAGDARLDRLVLRLVVFAGEKLDVPQLAPWVARFGLSQPRLCNMYGITETTVHSTFYEIGAGDLVPGAPNRVGVPLADLSIHLLDANGRLVPVGVPGEIYVGGPGVARGYLHRAELTAQRFVPDPFAADGGRLYRSGDVARRRLDGSLEFTGRADDQVKIRGFRVELGEIETALAAVDGVREARVLLRDDVLVAYVTADGVLPGPVQLRAALAVGLPEYMVPVAFVPLDRLPLTVNGKLDRRALPAPDAQALPTTDQFVAPRTPDEERIAAIWGTVLGVDRIGVHDSFFNLGGHSIRAVTLIGALRDAGYPATVRDVFAHRTVAELTDALAGRDAPTGDDRRVAPFELLNAADRVALPADVTDAYPLSRVQAGMVVEMLADPDLHAYHNVTSFRIRDEAPFSGAELRGAVDLVVARHEVLRTSIHVGGYSEPLQLVHRTAVLPVGVRELRDLDDIAVEAALHEFTARERATLFDLTRAPLMRLHAHVCDDKTWWLTVTECHPIIEGWSHHSMLMEILDYYRTLRRGGTPAPTTLPTLRYADFIAAEQRSLASAADREYWQDIVTRNGPFEIPSGWGADDAAPRAAHRTAVPYHDLEDGLRDLARSAGASMKSVLLAAHLCVLGQLTAEESFHTGLVLHGRPDVSGAEHVYGMYLNTLPIPFRPRTATSWRQVVADVYDAEIGMWAHRQYPMPAIAQELGADRRLLDTMFIYLDFDQVDRELVDYLSSIDDSPTEFPLAVAVRVGHVTLAVDTRVISPVHAERLGAMYRAVLEAMSGDPDGDATTTHLPPGERDRLMLPTATTSVVESRVHEVYAARVLACPDATALVCGGVRLSYAELDERANRFANHLVGLGVGPGVLVGVHLEREPELIPALLGVLKAGGAYLPLDPAQPVDRLGFMVSDAGVDVVVTSADLAGPLGTVFAGRLVDVDDPEIAACAATDPGVAGAVDDLVYVIYTSGSTGRPKGVCLSHRNVARLMAVGERLYGFRADDVWPLFHSFAFDVSVWEMWGALLFGGTLVVVPRAVTRSPDEFLDLLVEHRVTVLNQTPTAFRSLVALAAAGDARLDRLVLRLVVFAGEKLDVPQLAPWVARFGLSQPRLCNMYGITETTVHSTFYEIGAGDLVPGAPNRVGVPLADLSIHLLDANGRLVPVGVPGEIYVGGPGVARGYLHRAELTAQRFVPDPFAADGGRLYRSGDVARRRLDGSLEFTGRADDQVKIRGFRVELGEIETALAAVDGVREARVLLRDDVLVAYVTADGMLPGPVQLRAALAVGLPEYMVPVAFVPLDRLPLTVNGKLDRRALPAPDSRALPTTDQFVAPRTPDEERIAAIWGTVLGVDRIGVHDSFFNLGGHSIRAVTLIGALRDAGYPATVHDILTGRTVARLTELLADRDGVAEAVPAVLPFELLPPADRANLPVGVVDAYPMSQVQAGMVVEMLADEARNAYHVVTSFRVRDGRPFSLPALRAAAGIAADRHQLLRTSLHLTGYSVPLQLVHGDVEIPIGLHDLRGADQADQDRTVRAFTALEQRSPFDVATAPLLRFTVHVENDRSWWLTVTVCHPVTEGWSHRAMLAELLDDYARTRDGEPLRPYRHPPVRYADFIAAELRALGSAADRQHWKSIVDTHEPMHLPAGWGDDTAAGAYDVTVVWGDLEQELRALASTAGASLKSVLFAAHLTVLSRLTDAERFHTGLVTSARPEADGADRVYGMYLNILPFAMDRTAGTWRELIRTVYEREATAWTHRRFPMPAIQRELAGGERLFDVRFSYQEEFDAVDTDLIDVENGLGAGASEFPLAVAAAGGGLILTMDRRAISPGNADRLAGLYRAVLESMAADADGDARAAYLPDGDLHRLLVDFNRTTAAPVTRTVLELFEAQAAAGPDALAVDAGDRRLTYAELDALANRYAHHLRANGVRRGTGGQPVVGVLLDRGADLVAALLGVWKAGGAYVPLDPSHPAERLGYMLGNAGATLVVTQSQHATEFAGVFDGPVVRVDTDAAAIAARPATPLDHRADLDELAYVIYTSGSTGRPKGVQVPHRGLANHIQWAAGTLAGRGTTGAPLFSSVAFDLQVPNLYAPLVTGQPVHLFPAGADLDDLGAWLARTGPFSFIKLTPGHLDVLSHQLSPAQAGGLAPVVVVAGEAFTRRTLERWQALDPAAELINEYGPTEASVGTCVQPVAAGFTGDIVPIGRPLPGMTMYVLDHRMRPVPIGVPGELYVGGTGVARGYAARPDLTAERFLPDPFDAHRPGARLYRTGDLVRTLPNGAVDFLGRLDGQVKVRGYRIELDEIKTVLADHPAVQDAVVVTHDGGNGEVRLVAYCVPAGDGGELSVAALTEHCRTRLPEYMVPTLYVPVELIPLTANGKVDRRALPEPGDAAVTGPAFVAARSATETTLAGIWCTVLGLERVSVHDRFFALGGHSILMIQVLAASRKAGLNLAVAHMYQHETIAELAAVLDGEPVPEPPATAPATTVAVVEPDDDGQVILGPIQRRFLTLPGDRDRYTQAGLLDVRPAADPALLGEALRALVAHHDALRLSVAAGTSAIGSTVDSTPPLRVLVLTGDEATRTAAVRRAVTEAPAGHDVAAGRMVHATLLRGAAADGDQLLLSVHHLAVDIVSWSILVADLNDAYEALAAGRPVTLPERTTPFRRWTARLAAHVAADGLAAQVPFWLNRMPAAPLPAGDEVPAGGDTAADARTVSVALPRHLTAALTHDLPAAGQVRADEVVYAGLAMAVSGWTGGDRAAFDLEGHGREPLFTDVDTTRTVGWFTSLYPVSLWLPARREPAAVLRSVRDQLRAVPDRGIGYGMLRHLAPDPDLTAALAGLPQPQILVNYTGHRAVGSRPAGPDGGRYTGPRFSLAPQHLLSGHEPDRPRTHPIQITAGVHDHQLHVHWTYPARRYTEATIRAVAAAMLAAITDLIGSAAPAGATGTGPALLRTMASYHVPGATVAVLRDGEVVSCDAYGTLTSGGTAPVTPDTLFQVGSISKHVTAYGVLRLAAAGRVDLDTDVNAYLTSWRLEAAAGITGAVTLRQLLSHVAGLTVVRNSGYRPGEAAPTLLDLLRGTPGAGTPQLRVELPPGSAFRKSNGHYWVIEQLLRDLTGLPFPELMRDLVLDPIGMPATSFDQDFPATAGVPVATGHDEQGRPVPGGWRVKPVLASTGLWSSAADLARLLAEVRRAHLGGSPLLPRELAADLLTAVHADALYGLGTSVDDTGTEIEYGHVGESVGYRAMMLGRVRSGTGFVVLTNADSGKEVHKAVGLAVGRQDGRHFGVRQGQTELGY